MIRVSKASQYKIKEKTWKRATKYSRIGGGKKAAKTVMKNGICHKRNSADEL